MKYGENFEKETNILINLEKTTEKKKKRVEDRNINIRYVKY